MCMPLETQIWAIVAAKAWTSDSPKPPQIPFWHTETIQSFPTACQGARCVPLETQSDRNKCCQSMNQWYGPKSPWIPSQQLVRVQCACHWKHRYEPLRLPRHEPVIQSQTTPNPFLTHQNHSVFSNSLSGWNVCTSGEIDTKLQRHKIMIQPQTTLNPFPTHQNHSLFPQELVCHREDRYNSWGCKGMKSPESHLSHTPKSQELHKSP